MPFSNLGTSMARQLNIRSDTAYEKVQRLSRRLGLTATRVVETAVDRLDRETFTVPAYEDLTPEQQAVANELLELGRKSKDAGDPSITSDHNWLYDAAGLPK